MPIGYYKLVNYFKGGEYEEIFCITLIDFLYTIKYRISHGYVITDTVSIFYIVYG